MRSLFSVFMLQLGSYRVRYIGTRRARSGRVTVTDRKTPSLDSFGFESIQFLYQNYEATETKNVCPK